MPPENGAEVTKPGSKTVKAKAPRARLDAEFQTTATSLLRVVGRLQRVMADDRWRRNRGQLAISWDADIDRAIRTLNQLRAEFAQSRNESTPEEAEAEKPVSEGETIV